MGLCECGCGKEVRNRFLRGHSTGAALKGRKRPAEVVEKLRWSEERRQAFSAKMTGHPVSQETRRKMSEYNKSHGVRPPLESSWRGAKGKLREESHSWRGGVTTYPNGYRLIYRPDHPRAHPNGYVYEHILVAEDMLGRPLEEGERVHHADHDRLNNLPENLEVFASQSEHIRHHAEEFGASGRYGKGWMVPKT